VRIRQFAIQNNARQDHVPGNGHNPKALFLPSPHNLPEQPSVVFCGLRMGDLSLRGTAAKSAFVSSALACFFDLPAILPAFLRDSTGLKVGYQNRPALPRLLSIFP
jgi:hypothetical protein